jgi:o-succinylbenzoate synthase
MTIVAARITPVALPLRAVFATGAGVIRKRDGFVLELEDASGAVGLGDAMPLVAFGTEDLPTCLRALQSMVQWLLGRTVGVASDGALAEGLAEASAAIAPAAPTARCAVDVALHDLAARHAGISVACLLAERVKLRPRGDVAVNALVTGADASTVEQSAARAVAQGFTTFKLKVAALSLAKDVERVRALRTTIGPSHAIRLDANGAWSEAQATRALDTLAEHGIEYVEQPAPANDLAALRRLRERKSIPVAADEAIRSLADAREIIELAAADCLVIKPAVLGGLRPAMDVAAAAHRGGLSHVVTSFLDSAIGERAALHLAASVPGMPGPCGVATRSLFAADVAALADAVQGRMKVPDSAGLGIAPSSLRLADCRRGESWELRA